jgi:hypothetical protein
MSEESKGPERVTFSRGYGVCIMGIDGTWRRDCMLNAISDNDAILTVDGSIQGLSRNCATPIETVTLDISRPLVRRVKRASEIRNHQGAAPIRKRERHSLRPFAGRPSDFLSNQY